MGRLLLICSEGRFLLDVNDASIASPTCSGLEDLLTADCVCSEFPLPAARNNDPLPPMQHY